LQVQCLDTGLRRYDEQIISHGFDMVTE
jgi:hypothetical protein